MKKRHLIFLHGALADGNQLQGFSERFADRFNTHVITFGGHGSRSEAPYGFDMDGFVCELSQYIDQHIQEPVSLFGYSMGGYVALKNAWNYPAKVEKIVTLGTKLEWGAEAAEREVGMLDADKIAARFPAYAERLRQLHGGMGWRRVLSETASLMKKIGSDPLTDEQFSSLTCPVLMMVGELDKMVARAETMHVAGVIPNGRLQVLEKTPHPFEQCDQDMLFSAVSEFLA